MYPEDTFTGKSLTENYRIEDRDNIESFLSDLDIETSEKLESESRDGSEYVLYATVGLQDSFNQSYDYDLIHNEMVRARIVGDLHYKDTLMTRINERYRAPAYEVFPSGNQSSSEVAAELSEAELEVEDEVLAE